MNIKQLRHIVTIAECGSVTRAAEQLYVSQPAITRSIQALEKELEQTLFTRTTRKFEPTPAGEIFIRRARLILSELESSRRELQTLTGSKKSVAIVNGSPMTAPRLIPVAIVRMMQRHADLGVAIRGEFGHNYEGKLRALLRGETDVVLSISDSPRADDGLIRERLLVPELKIVARKDHPITRSADQSMRELRRYPWILPPAVGAPRVVIDNEFKAADVPPPDECIEISNRQALLSVIKQSDCLTAIPYHPACEEDDWSDIYKSPTRLKIQPLAISIITRSRVHLNPAANAFIDIVKELVREAEENWDRNA